MDENLFLSGLLHILYGNPSLNLFSNMPESPRPTWANVSRYDYKILNSRSKESARIDYQINDELDANASRSAKSHASLNSNAIDDELVDYTELLMIF